MLVVVHGSLRHKPVSRIRFLPGVRTWSHLQAIWLWQSTQCKKLVFIPIYPANGKANLFLQRHGSRSNYKGIIQVPQYWRIEGEKGDDGWSTRTRDSRYWRKGKRHIRQRWDWKSLIIVLPPLAFLFHRLVADADIDSAWARLNQVAFTFYYRLYSGLAGACNSIYKL